MSFSEMTTIIIDNNKFSKSFHANTDEYLGPDYS